MLKRRNFIKSLLAVFLMLILAAGCLSGCGGKGNSASGTGAEIAGQDSKESETGAEEAGQSTEELKETVSSEPITIKILTQLDYLAKNRNDVNNLYIFRYLEYYMRQQGYDVTIEVEDAGAEGMGQKLSLLLSTGDLPDIIWGNATLSSLNAVVYGANEGLLLDWTPYIQNEELMPNVYALTQSQPAAFEEAVCTDGGIYALPYLDERTYLWGAGNGSAPGVFVNADWLEVCGLEQPATAEEWLDMLRAFQKKKEAEGGDGVVYMGGQGTLESYLWTALGYYGGSISQFGAGMAIKDGQLQYPAATEDYREFIEVMQTMYSQGLIAEDYFSLDGDTATALAASLEYPVVNNPILSVADPEEFRHWVSAPAIAAGGNDTVVYSAASNINQGSLWASADTKHPEVIAKMVDYVFGVEGNEMERFGPREGEDPLGLIDGWYVKDGTITTKVVEEGICTSWDEYAQNYLYTYYGKIGSSIGTAWTSRKEDGTADVGEESFMDGITGDEVKLAVKVIYTHENIDGAHRIKNAEAWADQGHLTIVRLPVAYMQPEAVNRAAELELLLGDHVTAESVNFITGARPLEELDQFIEELKGLGVEEYIGIYQEAYSGFMKRTFE